MWNSNIWVKVARCKSCNTMIRLFPNYELSRRDHINLSICPICLQIVETTGYNPRTRCPECRMVFDPQKGVSSRGTFSCTECGKEQRILEAINNNGGSLGLELHGLEGYCKSCGRFFKRVDKYNIALWKKTKKEYEKHKNKLLK